MTQQVPTGLAFFSAVVVFAAVAEWLFFLHVVAYLSLRLGWMAVPTTLGVMLLMHSCLLSCLLPIGLFVIPLAELYGIVWLESDIEHRLKILAGE